MRVTVDQPDIDKFPKGFPSFWLNRILVGSFSGSYSVNALATTYVRLVEAALIEYRLAAEQQKEFWETNDSFNASAMHRSIAHYEACVTDMHRAVRCFVRIRRNTDVPIELRDMLGAERPSFVADRIADRLREVRNVIHHLEEEVLKGTIPEGASFTLRPDGPETPIEDEPGQTLKKIDRLTIGKLEISFSELAGWLTEMGDYAEKISVYTPTN